MLGPHMSLIARVFPPFVGGRPAFGLLFVRVVSGSAMAIHGSGKIAKPFSWAGEGSFPAPAQAIAAISEFFGGIALAAGILTPAACLGICATLLVAIYTHVVKHQPFVAKGGPSYELAAIHFAIAFAVGLVGPGKLSLDAAIFGKGLRK